MIFPAIFSIFALLAQIALAQKRLEDPTPEDLQELEGWKKAVLPGHSIDEEFFLYLIQSYRQLRAKRQAPQQPPAVAPVSRNNSPSPPSNNNNVSPSGTVFEAKPTYFFRDGPLPDPRCAPVQQRMVEFRDTASACGKQYKDLNTNSVAIANGHLHCGKQIVVDYNGKQITLTVEDRCPGCVEDNHIDASIEAMHELFSGDAKMTCAIDSVTPPVKWWFK